MTNFAPKTLDHHVDDPFGSPIDAPQDGDPFGDPTAGGKPETAQLRGNHDSILRRGSEATKWALKGLGIGVDYRSTRDDASRLTNEVSAAETYARRVNSYIDDNATPSDFINPNEDPFGDSPQKPSYLAAGVRQKLESEAAMADPATLEAWGESEEATRQADTLTLLSMLNQRFGSKGRAAYEEATRAAQKEVGDSNPFGPEDVSESALLANLAKTNPKMAAWFSNQKRRSLR